MKTKTEKKRNMWLVSLKGAAFASVLSVALVAVFAFVLQKQWLGMNSLVCINVGVKIISSAFAGFIAARASEKRAPLWAMAAACMYMLLTLLIFSLLAGEFKPQAALLTDAAVCVLAGALTGMLVNLRK